MESRIAAGDFKARCLKLIDDVAQTREPLLITKRGKPMARIVPIDRQVDLYGAMAGSVVDEADLVSPIDQAWKADR